jgi:hemerythrin superfamily protein
MTPTNSDVTTIVLEQHKDVARRLAAVLNETGSAKRAEFASLAALLELHETAEETVIYPVLRQLGEEGNRVADARAREESAANEVLTKLKGMDTSSPQFDALFDDFGSAVHAHAHSEEAEVIPLLGDITAEQRQAMGAAFLDSQRDSAGRR